MTKAMNTLLFLAMSLGAGTPAALALGPLHAKVVTEVKREGKDMSFVFKVVPDAGMLITKDGPWTLTIAEKDQLSFREKTDAKGNFPMANFDAAIPGFRLTADATASQMQKGKLTYKLRAFVCTEDKKRCYPELHTGSVTW